MVTVVKRKAVLRKPPRSQQDHVAAPYSFLSCFVGETQSTKMSPAQTDLLGNSCFCLKKNCSGIVHVVEMERTRTLSCTDIPLYSLETRRLVKCNKCFYVSTLQAHRLNSRGNAKLAAAQANEKETETETATIEDSQEVTENCSQAATEQDQQRDANGAYQDECSGIVAKNITYHGKPKNTVTNKSLDEEEQTSNVSQATSNNDDRLKMIMEGIRAKGREADKEADGEHQDTVTDDEEKPLYVEKEEFYPEEKKPPQWLLFVNDEDHVDTDDICSWHSGQRASQALTCRAPGDDGQSLTSSKKRDPNSGDPPQKLEKDLVLRSAPSTQSDLIHYIQRVSQDSSKKAPHDPPRHKADDEPLEGSSWCDPDKESPKATATTKDNQRRSSDPPMNDPPSTPVKKPADPKGTRLREPRGRKKSAPSKTSKLTNPARLQKRLQQHQQQKEGKQQEEEEGKRQQEKFNHVRSPEKEPIEESEQREAPDSPDLEAWRRNHEYKGDLSALSDDYQAQDPLFENFHDMSKIQYKFSRVHEPVPSSSPKDRDEIQRLRELTPPVGDNSRHTISVFGNKAMLSTPTQGARDQSRHTIHTFGNKVSPPTPDDRRKERGRKHRHARENFDIPSNIMVVNESPVVTLPTVQGLDDEREEQPASSHNNNNARNMQQQHKRNDTVRAEEEGQRKFNSTGDHDLDAIIQDSITYLKQRYPRHTSQHLNSFHSRTSDMLRNNNNVDKEYDQNTFVNKKNDAALALTPLPEVTVEPDMDNDSWVDLE